MLRSMTNQLIIIYPPFWPACLLTRVTFKNINVQKFITLKSSSWQGRKSRSHPAVLSSMCSDHESIHVEAVAHGTVTIARSTYKSYEHMYTFCIAARFACATPIINKPSFIMWTPRKRIVQKFTWVIALKPDIYLVLVGQLIEFYSSAFVKMASQW